MKKAPQSFSIRAHLDGDLLGDLVADLPGHLDGDLDRDVLAALPGDLFGDLVALLNRHALALLVISVAVALLLVRDVARRLVDGLVDGVAGLLVLGLVVGVVDGVTLLLVDGLVGGLQKEVDISNLQDTINVHLSSNHSKAVSPSSPTISSTKLRIPCRWCGTGSCA